MEDLVTPGDTVRGQGSHTSEIQRMILHADNLIHCDIEVVRIHLSEVKSCSFALAFAVALVVELEVACSVAPERGTRHCFHSLG